jgi:replication-associated recombination protein RarA
MRIQTIRKYSLLEVASALQKAIRRGDARLAGYWAIELHESNFREYVWRRLLTISAEDCWGVITHEVEALYHGWQLIQQRKKGGGRIFVAKAVILLAQASKSRDADHLTNLVYDPQAIDDETLERELTAARANLEALPEYAFDCHTSKGKRAGKSKRDFFLSEDDALTPRKRGVFDTDLEALRSDLRRMERKVTQ